MDLETVRHSFSGTKRGHGTERHNVKSLSRRLMLPRKAVSKLLKGGHLKFEQEFSAGKNGSTWEFSSAHLDSAREKVVDQLISDIRGRLAGLDMSEQEEVIATLQGLRQHKADVQHEFSSKPNDPDDDNEPDDDSGSLLPKVIGGIGGAVAGGAIGGAATGLPLGILGGAAVGGITGEQAGAGNKVAGVAAAGGLGFIAHKLIMNQGGYEHVAKKAGVGAVDLFNAVKGMLPTIAKAEI